MNINRAIILLFLLVTTLTISFGSKSKANLAKKEDKIDVEKAKHVSEDNKNEDSASKGQEKTKDSQRNAKAVKKEAQSKDSTKSESVSTEQDSHKMVKDRKSKATQASKGSISSSKKSPVPSKAKNNHGSAMKASESQASTESDNKGKDVISHSSLMTESQAPSFWSAFIVYILIFSVLCFGVKYVYFPQQPLFFVLVDLIMLGTSFFKSKKGGYTAPEYTQEIDDYNSITVGYNEQQGRQLFWQKNSVEGI